jgi:hypothetical protein
MRHNKRQKAPPNAAHASVWKEMAGPRMSRSARIAQQNLEAARIREKPSATIPGTVDKIIPPSGPSQPEKARISVEAAGRRDRHLRIENTLLDENGDDVRLKKGARVDVTVTAEPKK